MSDTRGGIRKNFGAAGAAPDHIGYINKMVPAISKSSVYNSVRNLDPEQCGQQYADHRKDSLYPMYIRFHPCDL